MKDLHHNINPTTILHPVVVSATSNSGDIDISGCNSVEFLIDVGADAGSGLSGANLWQFKLEHGSVSGTYAACVTNDILGPPDGAVSSGVVLTIDSTDEDDTLYSFGYVGGKPHLKLTWTESGTCSTPIGIAMIKGNLQDTNS